MSSHEAVFGGDPIPDPYPGRRQLDELSGEELRGEPAWWFPGRDGSQLVGPDEATVMPIDASAADADGSIDFPEGKYLLHAVFSLADGSRFDGHVTFAPGDGGTLGSSVAVAAHEAGHAIQDERKYAWLGFRSLMVPVTKIGSVAWVWVLMGGMVLQGMASPASQVVGRNLFDAALILFGAVVLFQLITLPVEFDASRRAKLVLAETGIVANKDEAEGVSKVLNAAAMTYVASALTSIATLLYLLHRRRD